MLDEQISPLVAEIARREGVDVRSLIEDGLSGRDDPTVLQYAVREGRIVVTYNIRDFSPLLSDSLRSGVPIPGVVFVDARTIPPSNAKGLARALVQLAAALKAELIDVSAGAFLKPTS